MSSGEENEGDCLLAEDARWRRCVEDERIEQRKKKGEEITKDRSEEREREKKKGQRRVLLNGCATERQQTTPPDPQSVGAKGDGMDGIGEDGRGWALFNMMRWRISEQRQQVVRGMVG